MKIVFTCCLEHIHLHLYVLYIKCMYLDTLFVPIKMCFFPIISTCLPGLPFLMGYLEGKSVNLPATNIWMNWVSRLTWWVLESSEAFSAPEASMRFPWPLLSIGSRQRTRRVNSRHDVNERFRSRKGAGPTRTYWLWMKEILHQLVTIGDRHWKEN